MWMCVPIRKWQEGVYKLPTASHSVCSIVQVGCKEGSQISVCLSVCLYTYTIVPMYHTNWDFTIYTP